MPTCMCQATDGCIAPIRASNSSSPSSSLALCLVWRNWAFILGILILEHVMLATDRVPAERIGWVWKILAVLIVFIVVLWPVFDQSGTHVLWQWGWLRLTQENLLMRR